MHDRAGAVAEAADVANQNGTVADHRDSAEQVLNGFLCRERYGEPTWFKLGDRDLATHVLRTDMLRQGRTLTEITVELARRLGIGCTVVPMSEEEAKKNRSTAPIARDAVAGAAAGAIAFVLVELVLSGVPI